MHTHVNSIREGFSIDRVAPTIECANKTTVVKKTLCNIWYFVHLYILASKSYMNKEPAQGVSLLFNDSFQEALKLYEHYTENHGRHRLALETM